MSDSTDVRRNWDMKEQATITGNYRLINKIRSSFRDEIDEHGDERRRHRLEHRGPEYIWYWTWDITINKILDCYEYLSNAPQFRITRVFLDDDGTMSTKSRIPDFAIMRHTKDIIVGERVTEEGFSRLVAIGEIKPAPIDGSQSKVREALLEARFDLVVQVRTFFEANVDAEAVVGISVAGDWWTFETFTRTDFRKSKDDYADYIPSSDMDIDSSITASSDSDELDLINQGTVPSSDRDELDLISQSTVPSSDRDELDLISQDEMELEDVFPMPFFQLLTEGSEWALDSLISAIRQLPGCEEFKDFPF